MPHFDPLLVSQVVVLHLLDLNWFLQAHYVEHSGVCRCLKGRVQVVGCDDVGTVLSWTLHMLVLVVHYGLKVSSNVGLFLRHS
jgi:hypothetical protein